MPNRINILNELTELGSVLASLPPVPAFEAPEGYFEAFPAAMLELATASDLPSERLQQARNNPYGVPQGYFEGLAGRLLAMVKATDGTATEEIALLSPLLSGMNRKLPFSTPEGYFYELAGDVTSAMAAGTVDEEEEPLSPMMSYLRGEQVYEVPAGYFEQFPEQVIARMKPAKQVKVVSFGSRGLVRYAAAAVIAGVIAVAGWMYTYKGSPDNSSIASNAPAPAIPNNISEETLQLYLEGDIAAPEVAVSTDEIKDTDIKEMLADISDEELQRYADKYSIKPAPTN